jgi:hypothetical protein
MSENTLEIIPTEIIRTETALSRFPIHRLSKQGEISIDIKLKNNKGELKTKWKVSHNSEFGQPSPLAYKVDTLIINRRIEEAGKPIPKLIRLGSLNGIAEELGLKKTRDTQRIKNALLQNVGTLITAKFTYKTTDGTERTIEIGDTRYGVVFTGEKLPNGDKADATYILLHDIYREILNSAPTRPLDYEYLKELSPIAQRFYELLSYQMYGAVKHKREAKMLYSEFCTYAPQTRFFDWEQVRPQMYRLHKPHLASGYIESFYYEQIRTDDGTLDWLFIYTAGRKAKGEHTFAMTRRKPLARGKEIKTNPNQLPLIPEEPTPPLVPEVELTFSMDEEELVSKMKDFKVSEKKARALIKSHREAVEREIPVFPYRLLGGAIKNLSGLFIKAVEEGYEAPQSYLDSFKEAESKKRFEAERKKSEEKNKAQRLEEETWKRAEKRLNDLPEAERQKLWEATRAELLSSPKYKDATPAQLNILESVMEGYIRSALIETFIQEENQKSGK